MRSFIYIIRNTLKEAVEREESKDDKESIKLIKGHVTFISPFWSTISRFELWLASRKIVQYFGKWKMSRNEEGGPGGGSKKDEKRYFQWPLTLCAWCDLIQGSWEVFCKFTYFRKRSTVLYRRTWCKSAIASTFRTFRRRKRLSNMYQIWRTLLPILSTIRTHLHDLLMMQIPSQIVAISAERGIEKVRKYFTPGLKRSALMKTLFR